MESNRASTITIDTWVHIIGIAFGLIGVFASIIYTGYQARIQQERQWQHEQDRAGCREENERASIRRATTVELEDLRVRISAFIDVEKEYEEDSPISSPYEGFVPEIYRAMLPRIVLLSSTEVSMIMRTYREFIVLSQQTTLYSKSYYLERMQKIAEDIDIALYFLNSHPETPCGQLDGSQ